MTPEELRAGLLRLLALVVAGAALVLAGAAALAASGRPFGRSLGAALGVAAVLLLLGALAAHQRTGPLERPGPPGLGEPRLRDAAVRRESERLALGLVVAGVACGALALALG